MRGLPQAISNERFLRFYRRSDAKRPSPEGDICYQMRHSSNPTATITITMPTALFATRLSSSIYCPRRRSSSLISSS